MGIFRNREFRIVFVISLLLTLAASGLAFWMSRPCGWIVLFLGLLFLLIEVLFSRWRYRNISRLSDYLKRVNNGNYDLDIRDQSEGELSILKTEIYKATVTLCSQAEALQQEKAELADAMSDISHQLKTPLTSMMVMTDLLCDPNLPIQKRADFTSRIRAQLERIEWLVTSLLKLAKIDAGTLVFNRQPILISTLIERAVAPILIPMDLRSQTLQIENADFSFACDLNWTAEALLNILKNCVEHTPRGGVLTIRCSQNALFTEIVISDNGSGIDPSDLPHIFERFYRGKNAGEDSVGIGLAMAKSMITKQDGSIHVESTPSCGTTFTVKFFR